MGTPHKRWAARHTNAKMIHTLCRLSILTPWVCQWEENTLHWAPGMSKERLASPEEWSPYHTHCGQRIWVPGKGHVSPEPDTRVCKSCFAAWDNAGRP